jgi:hypothetical protein
MAVDDTPLLGTQGGFQVEPIPLLGRKRERRKEERRQSQNPSCSSDVSEVKFKAVLAFASIPPLRSILLISTIVELASTRAQTTGHCILIF